MLRILLRDAKDFDTNTWVYAVSVVMGAMVILGLTVCILLIRDCYEDDGLAGNFFFNHYTVLSIFFRILGNSLPWIYPIPEYYIVLDGIYELYIVF